MIKDDEIPVDLPYGWEWCRLGDVCTKITDGFHHTPKKYARGKIYVSATHIRETGVDWNNCLYISDKDHEELYKKAYPQKGEILITNRGAGCATPSVIDIDEPFSFQNAALVGFNQNLILSNYMFFFILQMRQQIMERFVNGGLQPMLSNVVLRTIPFPMPPTLEQKIVVAKVEKLLSYYDQLERQINQSQKNSGRLMQTVLKEAFNE